MDYPMIAYYSVQAQRPSMLLILCLLLFLALLWRYWRPSDNSTSAGKGNALTRQLRESIVQMRKRGLWTSLLFLSFASWILLLAGIVGNVVDRVRLGFVVDFIDFQFGSWHYPTFNVADIAICTGAGLLILDMFLRKDGKKKKADEKESDDGGT